MEIKEAVAGRRSIRQFLKDPVPVETIRELISASLWAPSWGNTQPWELVVATGSPLEHFKKENKSALFSGKKPNPDIPMPEVWPPLQKERYVDVGKSVLTALEIPRKDLDGRLKYYGDMFFLFDAPALLLVLLDKELLLEYCMLDVGLFLQSFMLLALDKGLGTISLAGSVNYPGIIRECFSLPEDKRIVIGVAFGYPDKDAAVNTFDRKRISPEESIRWIR